MSSLLDKRKSKKKERKEIDVYKLLRIHRENKPEQVAIGESLLTRFASFPQEI